MQHCVKRHHHKNIPDHQALSRTLWQENLLLDFNTPPYFIPVTVHLQGMNISGHQRCSEKCAKSYSKRGLPYMVLTVAALLKHSSLKVTLLNKLYVYSYVCNNSIQEHYRQILHKCTCYILFRFLSTSDFLYMLAPFSTFGTSTGCTFYYCMSTAAVMGHSGGFRFSMGQRCCAEGYDEREIMLTGRKTYTSQKYNQINFEM